VILRTALVALILLTMALPACAGPQLASDSQPATPTAALGESPERLTLGLLLATFVFEGTDLAVTSEQAARLLPHWRAIEALQPAPGPAGGATSTPDPGEHDQIEGLLQQIQGAMSPEQLQAVSRIQVSWEGVLAVAQARGIRFGRLRQTATAEAAAQLLRPTPEAGGEIGEAPPIVDGFTDARMDFLIARLVDELIELLEERVAAEPAGTTEPPAADGEAPLSGAPGAATPNPTPAAGSGQTELGSSGAGSGGGQDPSAAGGGYRLLGGVDRRTGRQYSASGAGQPAVEVANGADLVLTDSIVTAAGTSFVSAESSPPRLAAGVAAIGAGRVALSNSRVTASGLAAPGIFSYGAGSAVAVSNARVAASGHVGAGVLALQGGAVSLTFVEIVTAGRSAHALVSGAGGGTITARQAAVEAMGPDSAGIHSAGLVSLVDSRVSARAEAAVIIGPGAVLLTDTILTSRSPTQGGVLFQQGSAGPIPEASASFTMTGGSLSVADPERPLFFVTGTTAEIILKGVSLSSASGALLRAAGGSTAAAVRLIADGQLLDGDVSVDALGSINLSLINGSALAGALGVEQGAGAIVLNLDSASSWTVTADSYLSCLSDPAATSGTNLTNVFGSGHSVFYNPGACPALGGQTYDLAGGGTLAPGH
jgi:hypothetical protein